jgi:hypothetical protein
MFICDPCMNKNFVNIGFFTSRGLCEYCGKHAHCYDIPSRNLQYKPRHIEPFEIQYVDGTIGIHFPAVLPAGYYWSENNYLCYQEEYVRDRSGDLVSLQRKADT